MIVERASFPGNLLKLSSDQTQAESGKIAFEAVVKDNGEWRAIGTVLIETGKDMHIVAELPAVDEKPDL